MIDWLKFNDTKSLFIIMLSLQIATLSLFLLDILGIPMPVLRGILSIPYLLFLPGYLILRLLKIDSRGLIEIIMYSLGLSISFIMFFAFAINLFYPILGVKNPLSFESIFISINVFVIILLFLNLIKTKTLNEPRILENPRFLENNYFKYPSFYFSLLLPFISILGTYIMNTLNINIFLMILILLISFIPILVAWNKFIPKKLYPLAVFMISLSLLFHKSLISFHIWGYDIQTEYYLSNLVITNGLWNIHILNESNSMLSIVMLAPVLSVFSGIKLVWIYKLIFPFIFAFVPLGLYKIFEKQTNSKIAFLSCFFFMSFFVFYQEMLQLGRQEIAEFFLVLILLLLINDQIVKIRKTILILIFSIALIVSHYGLSYIFIGLVFGSWILGFFIQKRASWFNNLFNKDISITSTIILFLVVTAIFWYMNTSFSTSFNVIVKLIAHISGSLSDFMNPQSAQGLAIITSRTVTTVGQFSKYIQIMSQAFIVIGVIYTIFYYMKNNFNYIKINLSTEYFGIIIGSLILCILSIGTPYLASALNTSRLYQINLIFLSVFCIIGGLVTLKLLSRSSLSLNKNLKILSIFLTIYLLVNTGFANQVFNEPTSISLTNSVDYPQFNQKEVNGANWLFTYADNKNKIYSDIFRSPLLIRFFGGNIRPINMLYYVPAESYFYMGTININNNEIATKVATGVTSQSGYTGLDKYINGSNKIYDNSGSEIFYNPYKMEFNK